MSLFKHKKKYSTEQIDATQQEIINEEKKDIQIKLEIRKDKLLTGKKYLKSGCFLENFSNIGA